MTHQKQNEVQEFSVNHPILRLKTSFKKARLTWQAGPVHDSAHPLMASTEASGKQAGRPDMIRGEWQASEEDRPGLQLAEVDWLSKAFSPVFVSASQGGWEDTGGIQRWLKINQSVEGRSGGAGRYGGDGMGDRGFLSSDLCATSSRRGMDLRTKGGREGGHTLTGAPSQVRIPSERFNRGC